MRILGIDSGMVRMGLGAVEIKEDEIKLVSFGLLAYPSYNKMEENSYNEYFSKGIHQIASEIPRMIDLVNPHFIVAETVPVGRLGSNDATVTAAYACIQLIAYQFGIEYHNVAANTVKKEITGDGKATKTMIRNSILDAFPKVAEQHAKSKREQKESGEKSTGLPQDVFDAVAIAIVGAKLYGRSDQQEVQEVQEG